MEGDLILNPLSALIIDPTLPRSWETPLAGYSPPRGARPPVFARSAREAQAKITEKGSELGAVYLNPTLTAPGTLSLIKQIHELKPTTPVYLLFDSFEGSVCPFSLEEMNQLAIQGALPRGTVEDFIRQLPSPILDFESPELLSEVTELESGPESEDYLRIPIGRFAFPSRVFFDVFIGLANGKLLKILTAGGTFSEDRLLSYIKRGVGALYIPKADLQKCLDYCSTLKRGFLDDTGIAAAIKIATAMGRGASTLEVIQRSRKIQPAQLEEVVEFTMNVRKLLASLDLTKRRAVQALLDNIGAYEHSLGTTVLSAVLSTSLKLVDEKSVEIMGMASFLHDVGLAQMPAEVQSEELALMNDAQKDLFWSHPSEGVRILHEAQGVHPVAIQVVGQHHERRNGAGFPGHLTGQQIHRFSEVIAFSDEFSRLIQSRTGHGLDAVIDEMRASSLETYSLPLLEAFHRVFGQLSN